VTPNQTIVTTKLIDRYPFKRGPYDGTPAGERGTILDIDQDTGHVLVQLERYFESLRPWRNCTSRRNAGLKFD
jgi:hypothetical protein